MRKYNKFQKNKDSVVQNKCTTKKLQFSLSGDDLILFEKQKGFYNVKNESDFIRDKVMDSIYKDEIKRQQYELDGI